MKFFGEEIKEVNRGYFGVRRCTICGEKLRDVNLVELYPTFNICFIPIKKRACKRILVCQECKAFMEIDESLWNYYASYINQRFDKSTTDGIIKSLADMNNALKKDGVNLKLEDEWAQKSIDLIYNSLVEKYGVWQNVEEIVSVFYK